MAIDWKANNKSTKQNGVSQKGHTYEVNEQKMFLDFRKDNQMLLICCRINYSVNLNRDFSSFSIPLSMVEISYYSVLTLSTGEISYYSVLTPYKK